MTALQKQFTRPVNRNISSSNRKSYDIGDGNVYSIEELSAKFEINQSTLKRYLRTMTAAEAIMYQKPENKNLSKFDFVVIDGKSVLLKEYCESSEKKVPTIINRTKKNMTVAEAINTPVEAKPLYNFLNKEMSLAEISRCDECEVSYATLYSNVVNKHIPIDEAVKRKQNKKYPVDGEHLSVIEISRKYKIDKKQVRKMLDSGMTAQDIVNTPRRTTKYDVFGEMLTRKEIRDKFDISDGTYRRWEREGLSPEEIIIKVNENKARLGKWRKTDC